LVIQEWQESDLMFYVSGTTAADKSGNIIWMGNPYLQSIQIIKKYPNSFAKSGC